MPSKLLTSRAYRGQLASKGQWSHGFKGQVTIASDGLPVELGFRKNCHSELAQALSTFLYS